MLQQLILAKWGGMIFGEVMSNDDKYKGCRNKTSSSVSPKTLNIELKKKDQR